MSLGISIPTTFLPGMIATLADIALIFLAMSSDKEIIFEGVLNNSLFEEERRHPILSSGYLLVFHHCRVSELDCYDPMLHEIGLAHSLDGTKWTILDAFLGLRGSVPDIILRDSDFWIYA